MFDLWGPRRPTACQGSPNDREQAMPVLTDNDAGMAAHTTAGKRRQSSLVSGPACTAATAGRQAANASTLQRFKASAGFTLTELLVTMGVLVVLVLLFTQLVNSAATTMTLGNKRMDADSQARQLLDRMAIDFDQMLKRTDVSYFVKTTGNTEAGNDQIAFFSGVPGYYSQAGYNSNASLVAYRVNADSTSASYNKLERMGKGFPFNGAYTTAPIPLLFRDGTSNTTIQGAWPAACYPSCNSDPTYKTDPDYETAGPQVFRFEYYYLLSSSPSFGTANQLSAGPWTNTDAFSASVKDVAAIVVAIAVIDPKSRVLLTDSQLTTLAGTLIDFGASAAAGCPSPNWQAPGELQRQWQCVLDNTSLPRPAISSIRLYERYFYVSQ